MLRIGEYNTLIVDREKDFGFYLMDKQSKRRCFTSKVISRRNGSRSW